MAEDPTQDVFHVPVLVEQCLRYLITDPSGLYVDGTLGGGGHSAAILQRLNRRGRVVGIDRDQEAIQFCENRFSAYKKSIEIIHGSFGSVDTLLSEIGINSIDGFFLDLGLSSHQLNSAARGFSHSLDGPLDMRIDKTLSLSAGDVINKASAMELAELFTRFGEERGAKKIAARIIEIRMHHPIETTSDLADVVRQCVPARWQIKSLSRVFQSLRIRVNDEIEQLRQALIRVLPLLKTGRRIVVISYHSIEDRLVKRFFRGDTAADTEMVNPCIHQIPLKNLTKKVVRPTEEEVLRNPRSRSSRLRAAEKCASHPQDGRMDSIPSILS